ncbi:MAG: hypothetical protein WC008_05540 [Bacilli bacterium]
MFSKLLKHEFKNTYKETLFVSSGIMIVSLLISVLFKTGFIRIASFLLLSLVALYIMAGAVIIINIVKSFHTKMFTDEGYLTMTLPVSVDGLLLSKIIVNLVWILATGIVFILSLGLTINTILGGNELFIFKGIITVIRDNPAGSIIYIIYFAISLLSFVLTLVLTLAILNIGKIKKYKLLFGIGIYYGLNFVLQLASTIFVIIPYAISVSANGVSLEEFDYSDNFFSGLTFMSMNTLIVSIAGIIGFYFLSRYLIKNKLELM